ncbi:transmembrane protease serine 9 [Spodoptera frugiperda]|uniref:Transmembrane protease serine 9 n=1 Tax=Spodoptera frugiperda TaxID=7108 RepID=A0A9R0EUH7_SPOFR|nr:transmembrane protease serine 9 [Spodoptera frugiperda]
MKGLVFGLSLIVCASALLEVQTNYHDAIGIPAVEKIRALEEASLANEAVTNDNRIVGGALAPVGAHPYFGGLLINLVGTTSRSVCGSSLLSANRLVTAAHCWFDGVRQAWEFTVILGSNWLHTGGERIATRQVIMHPQYVPRFLTNDIAMIYLPWNAMMTANVRPIRLPRNMEVWNQFEGHWAMAAGFGKTSDLQQTSASVVSHVSLQVINTSTCASRFEAGFVTHSTLCTSGVGSVGICGGDSGGPLAAHDNFGEPFLLQYLDTMRAVVLLGLALVASTSALVEVGTGYHQAVGIPTAEKIRAEEEKLLAAAGKDNRVVGGAIAPANAHPYFAGLLISLVGTSGQSVCGSSLLSANRLVTAAHCWTDGWNQAWQFLVILGSNLLFSGGVRIATTDVIMHPQYSTANLNNDIAMIRLPTNVLFTTGIQPIALPPSWSGTFVGNWAVAAGFGRTSDQQAGASTIVSHVNLQVISVQACQAVFGSVFVVPSTICTNGAGGVGICGGDSGGPLVYNQNGVPTLIGVSSFVARDGCQLGFPSAFARVTSFDSFIRQYL